MEFQTWQKAEAATREKTCKERDSDNDDDNVDDDDDNDDDDNAKFAAKSDSYKTVTLATFNECCTWFVSSINFNLQFYSK